MKKNFLPYLPAYIHRGNEWYISFYQTDPSSGKRVRIKRKYGLNRIPNKAERFREAKRIRNEINRLLPLGYPFTNVDLPKEQSIALVEAIQLALNNKLLSDRANTRNAYNSIGRIFLRYLQKKRKTDMDLLHFNKREAVFFMNHLLKTRNIQSRSYNNYLTYMKSLFSELIQMEFIKENPFKAIKRMRKTKSKRRHFEDAEREIVAMEIYQRNLWLFRAVLLQYYCLIRPIEITRLRFKDFDFKKGYVVITEENAKTKKYRVATIPDIMLEYFDPKEFDRYPSHYFVFGAQLRPHPNKKCSKNYMGRLHREILKQLHEDGHMENIDNLTFYSWKYTGMTRFNELQVSPIFIQDQAGHADINQILDYIKRHQVNQTIKRLEMSIF